MAEHLTTGADGQLATLAGELPHRAGLLRFARALGVGPAAEQLVDDALLAAVRCDQRDGRRVWTVLADSTAGWIADRYRRAARAQVLIRHRGLVAGRWPGDAGAVPPAEPGRLAGQLVELLPPEIMDVLWRHHVGGASWDELAVGRETTAEALRLGVGRALVRAHRQIGLARPVVPVELGPGQVR